MDGGREGGRDGWMDGQMDDMLLEVNHRGYCHRRIQMQQLN